MCARYCCAFVSTLLILLFHVGAFLIPWYMELEVGGAQIKVLGATETFVAEDFEVYWWDRLWTGYGVGDKSSLDTTHEVIKFSSDEKSIAQVMDISFVTLVGALATNLMVAALVLFLGCARHKHNVVRILAVLLNLVQIACLIASVLLFIRIAPALQNYKHNTSLCPDNNQNFIDIDHDTVTAYSQAGLGVLCMSIPFFGYWCAWIAVILAVINQLILSLGGWHHHPHDHKMYTVIE